MAIKASATITLSSIRDLQSCTRYYLLQSSTAFATIEAHCQAARRRN